MGDKQEYAGENAQADEDQGALIERPPADARVATPRARAMGCAIRAAAGLVRELRSCCSSTIEQAREDRGLRALAGAPAHVDETDQTMTADASVVSAM